MTRRRRSIAPTIWDSEKLADLPILARFLFIGIISTADDDGRRRGSARSVKKDVLPYDDTVTLDAVAQSLAGLHKAGVIVWYEVDGEQVIQVLRWKDHQIIDKRWYKPSPLPVYSDHARTLVDDALAPRDPREERTTSTGDARGAHHETSQRPPREHVEVSMQDRRGEERSKRFSLARESLPAEPAPKAPRPRKFAWGPRFIETWRAKYHGTFPNYALRSLALVVEEVGEDEAARRFAAYVEQTAAAYASVPSFCAKHGAYASGGGSHADPADAMWDAAVRTDALTDPLPQVATRFKHAIEDGWLDRACATALWQFLETQPNRRRLLEREVGVREMRAWLAKQPGGAHV